jgi:hypothetical protein
MQSANGVNVDLSPEGKNYFRMGRRQILQPQHFFFPFHFIKISPPVMKHLPCGMYWKCWAILAILVTGGPIIWPGPIGGALRGRHQPVYTEST